MTTVEQGTVLTEHTPGKIVRRSAETTRLRAYHQWGETPRDDIEAFMQNTQWVWHADISGATGHSWATIHGILTTLVDEGHVEVNEQARPWEYRWK